ncbi:hypothetical protein EYD10_14849 [Varanus komodoensis]|nr:hypothetical protein EYD10_14849 [Varanus komodoensis]
MENLHHRRQELERKEQQLKEAILKFDKFLKENDAKKSRALHKAGEEQRQAAQRGAEAERLRQEIAQLLEVKEKLQLRLANHKIFPMYLQQVVEKSEQFQEVPELIARFQALSATHAALTQREQVAREALEEERASLQQFLEESSNESLEQTNRVAELQARLEQAQTRAHELESSWVCIQSTAASKTLELGQIKLATLNLYQLVAKQRKLPAGVPQDDTEAQLDAVQLCIVDLTDILASFRKGEPSPARQPEPPTVPHAEAGPG